MTHIEPASPELGAVEVHGMSRSSFILRGALTAGAVYGAGAVAPFVSSAFAASGDIDILNFALTLEYLETDFYKVKAKSVGLSGPAKKYAALFAEEENAHVQALTKAISAGGGDVEILNFALTLEYLESDFYNVKGSSVGLKGTAKSYAKLFGEEEADHVNALTAVIKQMGGTAVAKPTFVFPATNQSSFLKLAYVLENTGVGAYNGAGPSLMNKAYLAAAGSIVQVEARHAASIALLTGSMITPDGAFDKPLSKKQVLAKAGPLIK